MKYIDLDRDEIIDDLIRVYEENNKLTNRVYEKYGKYSVGKITTYDTFNNLKEEAIGPGKIHLNKISKEKITKDILRVNDMVDNMTRYDYLKLGQYSRKPIDRHFGSWNKMLKELNLSINCLIGIPSEDLLEDLRILYDKFGTLSATIVKHHGKFSVEVYQRRFGSYKKAVELSGLDPNVVRGSDSPTALAMIKITSEVLGEKPLKEYTFEWLKNPKTNRNLYIDAYFPNNNIAFEYDGPQHFEPIDRYGGKKSLKQTQYLDNIKNNLLKKNNIKLIRFPYYKPHTRESIIKEISNTL